MESLDLAPVVRLRDAARTRAAILQAAQALFAHQGYAATGIRDVAAQAGVNWSLVRRYFGSKEGLLRAALEELLQVGALVAGERSEFGARVARLFFETQSIPSPVAMMMMAGADPEARDLCRQMFRERINEPLAAWLGGSDGAARALRLNMLWTGYYSVRQLLLFGEASADQLAGSREWLARMTQAIADGD